MVVSALLVIFLVQQYHVNHEHRWQKNCRNKQNKEVKCGVDFISKAPSVCYFLKAFIHKLQYNIL